MRVPNFHVTMTAVAVTIVALSGWGMYATNLSLSPAQLLPRLALLVVLLAGVAFYRWRNAEKAANLILMTFWAVLIGNLLLLPMYVIGRRTIEPCDAQLARMDARLGVEVPDVMRLTGGVPGAAATMEVCYDTLIFLMTAAIVAPPLYGRMDKAKEYALANVAAAAISLPLFAAFQALGPWSYYGYAPLPTQEQSMRVLLALKTGDGFVLDLSDLNGLICFPSFHAILALLSAAALWPLRYLRWPSAGLAVLIVLSTVTTGWHYVVDVVGGLVVAPASVALARGYLRWERR